MTFFKIVGIKTVSPIQLLILTSFSITSCAIITLVYIFSQVICPYGKYIRVPYRLEAPVEIEIEIQV